MEKTLTKALRQLDRVIEQENDRRSQEATFVLPKGGLRILGQCSLLLHPDKLLAQLSLFATADVDALVDAHHFVKQAFQQILEEHGLQYDEDSEKVWLPPGSTFTTILSTPRLECQVLDPLYSLTSKAIKAKEKNRLLIRDALQIFGEPLRKLVEKFGGDCGYFQN
ncbi:MAG: hypothetical protein V1495_07685 [Pseudomonadota bacterium]